MLEESCAERTTIVPVPAISKWGTSVLKKICKKHRVPGYAEMDRNHLIVEAEKLFKSM